VANRVLTQAELDAQSTFAAANGVNPAQAELIKKNAQGNIMSPGVLQSLSALGVPASSGVAQSIANIDAHTRDTRLADQKALSQQRQNEQFDNSNLGRFWRGVKSAVRGVSTVFSTIPEYVDATYRTTLGEIKQRGVVSGVTTGLGINPLISGTEQGKIAEKINAQTQLGQIVIKSITDAKAGNMPDINVGNGFFPSEETGLGHAARQASLDAAKIAIKNSNGKIIGYRPRTFFGDPAAQILTKGNPESQWGQVISLVADVAGSFMLDPGIARAQQIKAMRLAASQERAKGALDVAAKIEQNASDLEEAQNKALEASKALRNQSNEFKKIDLASAKQNLADSTAAWTGANEAAIKASKGVAIATARRDEIFKVEQATKDEIASLSSAINDLEVTSKTPNAIARTESAITKQLKELDRINSEKKIAEDAGRISMYTAEDIDKLNTAVAASQAKLDELKGIKYTGELPIQDALTAAKESLARAKSRLTEASVARKYSDTQIAERTRTAKITQKIQSDAARAKVDSVKNSRTLDDVMNDATASLEEKQKAWSDAVKQAANLAVSQERPELAYEKVAQFLTGGHGTVAVDRLVEMTDWKEIWRRSGGRLNHETAKAIADATTPDEVVDILAPYLKRGDIQAGALKPGILSRTGERISDRVPESIAMFNKYTGGVLQGVGAQVFKRMPHYDKVTNLFDTLWNGTKTKYMTKVKAGSLVNIHDREELLRVADDFGRAARLDKVELNKIIDKIANAPSAANAGYTTSVELLDTVFKKYAEKIPPHLQEVFQDYTTAFKSSAEQMSSYWATRHAAGAELKYINLKGESVLLPGPHMDSELLNSTIYMPPVSELLKMTGKIAKYKNLNKAKELTDTLINKFWKTTQLVRPAYIIRNIAEEQIRVFGTGHISIFNNPGMALAMWLGREDGGKFRQILNQFDTYRNDIFDTNFTTGDESLDLLHETAAHAAQNSYIELMSADKSGSFDERAFKVMQFKNVGRVPYGHPRFYDGVANQLRLLNSSEFARVVAGSTPPSVKAMIEKGAFREDAVVDYFLNGAGRKTLDKFAESAPEDFKAFIRTPDGLKKYLYTARDAQGKDISMMARVAEAAGGNKALIKLVANGKTFVSGQSYEIPRAMDSALNSLSNAKAISKNKKALLTAQDAFAKDLKNVFDKAVNYDGVEFNVPSKGLVHAESKSDKYTFVNWFFDKATELEKNSTMGPEFRQAYWDAISQIAKSLDHNAVKGLSKVVDSSLNPLQKAGIPIGSKHPVWNAFKAADGMGPITLEDAHAYADTYARNHVKGLFYNAQEKRLLFHQLRLIAPFANAWEDTIHKWAEIALDNPMQVYKGVKTLDWLQKPESSAIYQVTDARDYYNPDQGFFYSDPNSGQRMFWVPFAGSVMAKLAGAATGANYTGAPMSFAANPASFNFALGAGSILPGVGPGITIPISALGTFNNNIIDNMPMGVQKWLFPFGRSDFSSGIQSAVLPANWNKILGGITGIEATYSNNFKPVMGYLSAGGNYNLDNPDDQAQLIRDTDTFSRWQSVMRGVVGLFSPVSLVQQGLSKDTTGDVTTQVALYNDFQNIMKTNDGDYNKSWYDFLNLYGASQAFALITSSAGNGPSNWDSYAFVVKNPDVASKYKDVWGYVMPGGGLSTEMYQWNLSHGVKSKLNPQQILDKVNNQRFYAAKDALLTKVDAGELDKNGYKTALQYLKDSMGGGPVAEFDPNKRNRVLIQLEGLTQDKRFTDIPSVTALRDYMGLRQVALNNLGKRTFTGAQNEQSERDWLAAQAEWIIKENPDFQKMFYGFFSNELEGK